MNTPTHILVACALLSQSLSTRNEVRPIQGTQNETKTIRHLNIAVIVGGMLPDLSIFIFFVWAHFFTVANFETIWGTLYWTEPWQTFSAVSNSIPLILTLILVSWRIKSKILLLLALSMLSHIALDLPFHADDAHKHFWPISNFRFHSPLSYWDTNHHSQWVTSFECLIMFCAAAFLIKRFQVLWVRIISLIFPILHLGFIVATILS